MKKIFAVFCLVALCMVSTMNITVFAHGGEDDETQSTTTTRQDDKKTEQDDSGEDSLHDRWEKHKSDFKVSLTFAQQVRLKLLCKPAQTGHIQRVSGRLNGIETSRKKVHTNITERLDTLVAKLKVANIDTTTLEADIVTLKAKIKTFTTDFATYKQAVSDIEAIDCTTEPEGFQASLEAARSALHKVRIDAQDIRTYVKETIQPELTKLKAQIETKQEEGDN